MKGVRVHLGTVYVVGLGAGSVDALPYGTLRLLKGEHPVFLRTKRHPVVSFLENEGIRYTSFDDVYEQADTFDEVYQTIVDSLILEAAEGPIVYAVPGHPGVAEKAVRMLAEQAPARGVIVIFGVGQSFLDDMLLRLHVDPVEGLLMLDASGLERHLLVPRIPLVVVQMYSKSIASDVKIALSEVYGDDHEVVVAQAVGIPDLEVFTTVPLYQLDQACEIDHLTTLYVPPVVDENRLLGEFSEVRRIVEKLRSPEGYPWDQEQSHESLRPYVIEEAYEVAYEIDQGNLDGLVEELGDLLLQIMLHAQIGDDEGYFGIHDIIRTLNEKLIRRHPHVFGELSLADADAVNENWQRIKAVERADAGGDKAAFILDAVSKGLPPFKESMKLQKYAAEQGFEWPTMDGVKAKLQEEVAELLEASSPEHVEEEFGDVLFVLANWARREKMDPDQALMKANTKFRGRFNYIEGRLRAQKLSFHEATLDILEEFWQNAKREMHL